MVWDEEQEAEAKRQVEKNSKTPVSTEDQGRSTESGFIWIQKLEKKMQDLFPLIMLLCLLNVRMVIF